MKTSDWLVMSGFKTCRHNYDTLMEHLFGKVGIYTYFLFTFLYAYGADIAYIIIMSTNMTSVMDGFFGVNDDKYDLPDDSVRRIVVAFMATVFVLPLALLRDMVSSISSHVHLCGLSLRRELIIVSYFPLSIAFVTRQWCQLLPTLSLCWSSSATVPSLPKTQTKMGLVKTSHFEQTLTD